MWRTPLLKVECVFAYVGGVTLLRRLRTSTIRGLCIALSLCDTITASCQMHNSAMTGTGPSIRSRREEVAARMRSTYEAYLTRVIDYHRGQASPRCYLSRAPGNNKCAIDLIRDLQSAGVYIVEEAAQVQPKGHARPLFRFRNVQHVSVLYWASRCELSFSKTEVLMLSRGLRLIRTTAYFLASGFIHADMDSTKALVSGRRYSMPP